MGFTYDYYVSMQDLESVKAESRANVLVKAIGLDDEQIRRYEGILQKLPAAEMENRTYEDYTADCAQRRQSTCSQFTADKNGFTAHITLASENLVFFSVPYDDGFTATVNGQAARIERVDGGLMAVAAPAGENEIVFTYHTPGLAQSAAVAAGCTLAWVVYLFVSHRRKPETTMKPEE